MNSFLQQLKKTITLILFFIIGIQYQGEAQQLQTYKNGVLQGAIKIKLTPELVVSSTGLKSVNVNGYANVGINNIDKLNQEFKTVKMERLFRYSPKYETRHQKHGLHLWYKLEVSTEEDIVSVLKAYNNIQEVEKAELFLEKKLIPYNITVLEEALETINKSVAENPFDDPRLDEQWHYHNTGQVDGVIGADINLFKAWEKQAGASNVVVAIIDEGVDYNHEDLNANMWVNEAELNGEAGVDSDGNGFVDDIYGYNFALDQGDIDAMNHGTHVGGTVAAVNNNGIGVSGVAGGTGNNDGARMMSCQIMGNTSFGDPAEAFVYAADNGAVIAQNSWGYNEAGLYEQSILDAIDYFVEEAGNYEGSPMKGGVAIFASGNLGMEGLYYPGCYENVIAVTATGPSNEIVSYSNYGEWIDISAPGGNVDYGNSSGVLSTLPDNSYGFFDGTSMACPHVSGVAALIVSEFGGAEFDNEMLKTRLLGGVNVIDTISFNTYFAGKMGVGALDAHLALQNDEGIAPNAITDLTALGTSNNFALLQWTVPADEDDENPRYFDVVYSTESITDANLESLDKIRIESNLNASEIFEYELQELNGLSNYNIIVQGVDRWGNIAEISNLIQVSTNNGSKVSLTPELITFSMDVKQDTLANKNFTISNAGEGMLKYAMELRHVENTDIYENEINPFQLYSFAPTKAALPSLGVQSLADSNLETFAQKEDNDWLYYFDDELFVYTLSVIGDYNTEIPNSMATHFEVSDDEGFNITTLELGLNIWEDIEHPVVVEIRVGSDIFSSKLLYTKELFYSEITGASYLWELDLEEQIFFSKGTEFWIIVHTPPGLTYPLLACQGRDEETTYHSYYSSNLGNSWELLRDVYYDYTKVWAVTAWSKLEGLDSYVSLSPKSGYISADQNQEVDVQVNASNLINGDYETNIVVFANDTTSEINRVKLEFDVTGQDYELTSSDIINFSDVFIGEYSTQSTVVKNVGLGAFAVITGKIEVDISHPDFTLTSTMPKVIAAQRETELTFRYTPTSVGPANAVVTLTEQNGETYRFSLYGVGTDPALAVISPADTYQNNLDLGDEVTGTYYLHNDGAYPLRYYVPKFADGSNMPDFDSNFIHKFGYAAVKEESTVDDPAFEWIDISETGEEISEKFRLNSTLIYQEALIGFQFPFFGSKYDTCYITNWGAISFSNDGWFNSTPASYKNYAQPSKLVSAWGMPFYLEDGGKILYQQFPGKLIVQYQDVPHGTYYRTEDSLYPIGWHNVPITFQIVLHNDGSIEFNYKDLGTVLNTVTMGFNSASALISIEDADIDDGLIVNGYGTFATNERIYTNGPNTGDQILFKSPGYGVIETLTNPFGTVHVGDSVRMDYTASTETLFVEDFEERINIISNDPINKLTTHTVHLNIVRGGERKVEFTPEVVDFGLVFEGDQRTLDFRLSNNGTATADIVDIAFSQGNFIYEGYMPVALKSRTFATYSVTLNAESLGVKDDVLEITDEQGTVYTIPVKATVIEAPFISADEASLDLTLNYGEKQDTLVTIKNDGLNAMMVSPISHEWMMAYPDGVKEHSSEVEYETLISRDTESIYSNWIDLSSSVERLEITDPFDEDLFWQTIPLEKSFSYYGNSYDTLYIGYTGLITFTKDQEAKIWGPTEEIPDTNSINNFLAPLYGFHGTSHLETYPNTGVYVQQYDDKVVVLFQDMMNGFGLGLPVSFEVILYQNGVIKYLYDFFDDANANTAEMSIVGLENEDGSKGIQVMNRIKQFLFSGTTITFIPHEYYEIPAESSQVFNVAISAESLYDGMYNENLTFRNNTPSDPDFSVPVNLQVIGKDNLVVQDTLELGELFMVDYDSTDYTSPYKRYDFDFTLLNNGSKVINIKSVKIQNGINHAVTMGDDNKFGSGTSEEGWIDISRRTLNYSLRPLNSETFRLRVYPMAEAIVNDSIVILSDDIEGGSLKIPVSSIFTLPPVIAYPDASVNVYANNYLHIEDRTISINNTNGSADLSYEIELEFERSSSESSNEPVVAQNYFVAPTANQAALKSQSNSELKSGIAPYFNYDDYNRILEYDEQTSTTQTIGYGDAKVHNFHAATGFFAPFDGFNLSHVMVWYSWGEVLESDIEVLIKGGSDNILDTELLYSYTYHHVATGATSSGEYITIELDENQVFFPNEKFFIELKFDKEVTYPQGAAVVNNNVANRYYYGNGTVYFDFENGYNTMGLMMKAAEKEPGSNVWSVLNSEETGVIKEGESKEFDLTFIAQFAKQGINTGNFTVRSNDPINPTVRVPLKLTHNKGPQYADGDNVYYSIAEMDTLNYTLIASDEEGDDFTLSINEEYDYLEYEINDNQIDFQFTPDYDGEGIHSIKVVGEDIHGNVNIFTLQVSVNNVNRAPVVYKEFDDIVANLESEDGLLMYLTDYVIDPDGDELHFELSYENTDVVEMLHTKSTCVFMPLKRGYVNVALTATDPMGASLSTSFPLFVEHRVGVDEISTSNIKVYPNPTSNFLYFNVNTAKVIGYQIIDASGSIVLSKSITVTNAEVDVNVEHLSVGIYMLKVITEEGTLIKKFTKR